ncbi:TonB-linked outer membrane protein, SusC/RagA family [Salegentibacter agarivorans]|uniref:TonB-linked outer membrane protein, SusC/RagA family n=1 Tax=Salegentibacter agarivorans TaxID=345907 RepID=A0A1I2KT64_9FLAO|nr:TonB-dependent receptor [Salegentibacter agarivorans]SFF68281.1 TonB-linked outer membrane protein, SusC/RagA family [Salegentibacter agarivorans]
MNRKLRNLIPFVFFLFVFISAFAQQKTTVSGTITEAGTGIPVPGANIVEKGTTNGVMSDFDGNYSIEVSPGAVLEVSFLGYTTKETQVNNQNEIDIVLEPETSALDEVVVVGYGTQKKKELTGAVGFVDSEVISKAPVSDLGSAIQGQVAGVNVQASSGRPGDEANIQIRGLGSISSNGLAPLYVVDGIPYQGNPNIAPEQIASIDILKDGAAAAVYGTRASNGVIIITTKKGQEGKMSVNFSAYGGIQNITSGTPLMNTQQQMYAEEVVLNALGREPLIFFFNPNALDYDTDFVEAVQNDNAPIQNYNLLVSGGTENLTLSLNTNYFDQEGVLINSGFNRLSNRITGEFTRGKFKAFASLGLTTENTEQEPFALYEYAIAQVPWQPPFGALPSAGENSVQIPVRNAIQYSYLSRILGNSDDREVNSSNIALNLEYEFFKGFKYKVNLGRNTWNYSRKFFQPQYLVYNTEGEYNPTASREDAILNEDFTFTKRDVWENQLTYNLNINNHTFNLLGVLSYEKFDSKQLGVGVIGLLSNETPVLGAGSEGIKPNSYDFTNSLSGMLFRLQYNYAGKYLFSGSFRRDGSSNFGEENRYGNFIGLSAGWNISDEEFFRDLDSEVINNLKLRASWAEVGNQSIDPYSFASQIETGINYPFGPNEELSTGAIQRRYANSSIKWETSISKNIGLDLEMFDRKLNFTADVYENEKEDMLLQERLPPSSGTYHPRALGVYDVRVINAGNMINRGLELSLSYRDETSYGLNWNVSATFTKNDNEVTNLNGVERGYANGRPILSRGTNTDYTTFLAEGYEAGAFFLVQNDGIIKTEEELEAYRQIDASAQLGDIRYIDQPTVDTNGDGVADTGDGVINNNDRVYSGSGQAEFESGLNFGADYKGFDLFVQTFLSYGAELYNGAKLYAYTAGRHLEQYSMWSPQNPNSNIPTFREDAFHSSVRARTDYFMEDGSYLRIRNITLGYSLPESLTNSKIDKARLYLTAMNPFTFTEYTGYDPEIGGDGIFTRGIDRGNYPVARRFLVGMEFRF